MFCKVNSDPVYKNLFFVDSFMINCLTNEYIYLYIYAYT